MTIIICRRCHQPRAHDCRGLCHTCRMALSRQGRLDAYPRRYCRGESAAMRAKRWRWTNDRRIRRCKACGESVMRGSSTASDWNGRYCLICKTEYTLKGATPWPRKNHPTN